jgi:hypothetical protein
MNRNAGLSIDVSPEKIRGAPGTVKEDGNLHVSRGEKWLKTLGRLPGRLWVIN